MLAAMTLRGFLVGYMDRINRHSVDSCSTRSTMKCMESIHFSITKCSLFVTEGRLTSDLLIEGEALKTGDTPEVLWRWAMPCSQACCCYLWYLQLQQKLNYPIMYLQHNSLNALRHYIETNQQLYR